MSAIFGLIATPMGYVMEYIYKLLQNYGYAIIAFALLAKIIMLPLSIKQKRSMIATQRLNPKLQEIQKKYGSNREKYAEEAQKLYDEAGVSPMGGCGTSLLSFPIMIGLYYVVTQPLSYFLHMTAEEITKVAAFLGVETNRFGYQLSMAGMFADKLQPLKEICSKVIPVDFTFYGFDLTQTPSFKQPSLLWLFPILSALTAWGYSHVMNSMNQAVTLKDQSKNGGKSSPENEKAMQMTKSMSMMMPIVSGYFAFILPAAVSIYWIVNNLFSCVQEVVLTKYVLDKEEKEYELYSTGGKRSK